MDPLRAARVLWLEDGVRYLCGEDCRSRFLRGEREFDSAPAAADHLPAERPSIPDLVREATLVRKEDGVSEGGGARPRYQDPLITTALAIAALSLVLLTPRTEAVWLAALLVTLCALVNARVPLSVVRASRSLQVVAPLGLAIATVVGLFSTSEGSERWALTGVAVAAIAVSIRTWVHASMSSSVRSIARELRDTLPPKARVPSQDGSTYEEVPVQRLRQGDLVVVLEGEHIPADGLIERGSGHALRYPKAAHSREYAKGDFMLAGTQVLEGAITLRVRRTGKERGIVRAIELSRRQQQDRALVSRLRWALINWSWLALTPISIALVVWAGPVAAAVFLLGVPVLGALAAFDVPLQAGALSSARRGMFFGSSRALRDAGNTGTTAILLRGALTAGEPIVQQVHRLGNADLSRVVALAAAAEKAAGGHPIARAIRRYRDEHGGSGAPVRRVSTHAGLGVTAVTTSGVPIVVGRRQLLLDEGISVATADQDAAHLENEGLTPIFVALDGRLEALFAILDPTHVGARDAVQRIADLPCEVVILSGDDLRAVERIAAHLGASRVKAPLLPHERVAEVRALRETGGITATIGRGSEDDPVLAAADVPVSLRLEGSTLEDRGIAVASHDVRDAAGALWIARAARRSTWRSIGICLVVTVVLVLGAGFGWMTPVAAALLALGTEAWMLRAGSHLLRRVDLRVPMQQ